MPRTGVLASLRSGSLSEIVGVLSESFRAALKSLKTEGPHETEDGWMAGATRLSGLNLLGQHRAALFKRGCR